MRRREKERVLSSIEDLLRRSFYEGTADDDVRSDGSMREFAGEYLLRSKCFWSIEHLMQYIEAAVDSGSRRCIWKHRHRGHGKH